MMRMQRISRAPVLSATRSRDSTWTTTAPSRRSRPGASASGCDSGPALDDAHDVALVGLVALVVGVQLRRAAHGLPVDRVRPGRLEQHGDGLVAGGRHHDALTGLAAADRLLGRRGRRHAGQLPLAGDREQARDLAPARRQLRHALERARGVLEAQVEVRLAGLAQRARSSSSSDRSRISEVFISRPRASRTCSGSGACSPRGAWRRAPAARGRRTARTSPSPASRRPPRSRASPCRSPCGSRPASW